MTDTPVPTHPRMLRNNKLNDMQVDAIGDITQAASVLLWKIDDLANRHTSSESHRAFALARTKLEEAVMWSTKGITR